MSMTIILVGPGITQRLFEFMGIASETNTFWTSIRLPMAFLLNLTALSILYYFAPEARQTCFWHSAGSLDRDHSVDGGLVGLPHLPAATSGPTTRPTVRLAAVVILMVWLWISGLIFLLGAEINALMKRIDDDDPPRRVRLLR